MKLVGILGNDSLLRGKKLLHHCGEVKLLTTGQISCFSEVKDLKVLLALPDGDLGEGESLPSPGLLILPDSKLDWLAFHESPCVMTYGMEGKNSLTLSSIEEDSLLFAIQRELVTIEGGSVERQEFSLPRKGGETYLELLGFVALLLVCGVSPDRLEEIVGDY